ncbi:hypothetical protein BRARA_F01796, partial [Brassica rapa]
LGYLKDVEAREKEDEVSKEWTKLVLDIAYDVEDVLDCYNLKVVQRSQRRGLMRLIKIFGETMESYRITDDMGSLKRRISDLTRKRETYGIGNFNEPPQGEGNISSLKEELVVGLDDDAKILLAKLLDDDDDVVEKRYIFSILGMRGLGKTAIARKLYNSGDVKRRFEYRTWTYVSQEYKTRDMLVRIIRSLGIAIKIELKMFSEEELEDYLNDILDGQRYLVVSLKRALPCNNHGGSRVILITTRIRAVAEGVEGQVYAHKLSWKLFEHKAYKNMEWVDEDLQRIGKEIVQKCVVLAGLMSRKRANEWNDVCASLKDNSIHISTVFDLSYKELNLCFLYLSVLPEDYEIEVEQLIHLFVAEGFIHEDENVMMEDVARYFIEELIDKSLGGSSEKRKRKSDINFVHVYNGQHSSTTCRREVVHYLINNNDLCDRCVNKRMRSFLFFGEKKGMIGVFVQTITLNLKLLRVLNLGGLLFLCKGYVPLSLPDAIGDLIQLRYLGIADAGRRNIPTFISNVQEQTDLSKLTSLRHVTGKFFRELLIGDVVNLQTLRSISSYSWTKLNHELLINLRDVEIYDRPTRVGERNISGPLSLGSFSKLKNLLVLKLEVKAVKISPKSEEDKLPRLEDLVLKECEGSGAQMSISEQVRLDELDIEEKSMPSLLKLNLEIERGATKLMIQGRLQAFVQSTY